MNILKSRKFSFVISLLIIFSFICNSIPTYGFFKSNISNTTPVTLGALLTTNGAECAATNRCRTDVIDIEEYDVTIDNSNINLKYGVFCYDEDNAFLGWTSWLTSDAYTLADGTRYIRLVLSYSDNRVLDENGMVALSSCIIKTEISQQGELVNVELETGALLTTNGAECVAANRSRSQEYDLEKYSIEIERGNVPVKYGIFCYDEEKSFLGWTSWLTGDTYALVDGTRYIRLVLSYTDNRQLNEAGLSELASCIKAYYYGTDIATYTVTFDAGDGYFPTYYPDLRHTCNDYPREAGFVYHDLSSILVPELEGYTFLGWSTTANGNVEYTISIKI